MKENAGSATITVELTGVTSAPVTVTWATSDVTATAGSDYGTPATLANPTPPPPSGTLTFPPGGTPLSVRTKTFPVRILQDQMLEATETVGLTLSSPIGASLVTGRETATLSIVDDDIGGTIQFSAATYSVGEGTANATIVLTRTGGTGGGATIDYSTSNGTAVAGTDYTTASGTATFTAGQDLADVPGPHPRQRDARRRAHREPDAVESGAQPAYPDHEARDPIERGAEDLRQRPLAGVQCPDLLGEGERGAGHHHGRAGRRECHTGDRGLGHQRRHGHGRQRLRDSGNPGEPDATAPSGTLTFLPGGHADHA